MKINSLAIGNEIMSFYQNERFKAESKVTLILLHGGTLNKSSMLSLGNALSQHNIIIPDIMAHGDSKGKMRTSIEEHADVLEQFLEELYKAEYLTDKVVLVGYCLSGTIALEIGRRDNKYINGLIILAGGAKLSSDSAIHKALHERDADSFDYLQVFRTGKPNLEELTEKHLEILRGLEPTETCYHDLQCVANYNRQSNMDSILVPTLLISGDSDVTVPLYCTLKLRTAIPNSVLQVIPYVGHALLHSALEEVISAINKFVVHLEL